LNVTDGRTDVMLVAWYSARYFK